MTIASLSLTKFPLVIADLLKLRRRRGLLAITALLTVGAILLSYTVIELLHLSDRANQGPAGGVRGLGEATFLLGLLASVSAVLVGATAWVGDLEAGVYRELVVTGRARVALFLARLPAGLALLLPFVAGAYAAVAIVSIERAGSHPTPSPSLILLTGLWLLLEVTFYYVLAVALSCLIGSRSYTIAIALAWRLALTPLLSQITALGIVRELIPGIAIEDLAPHALRNNVVQGPDITMPAATCCIVLLGWAAVLLTCGGRRDCTRDT
ncbi:MAG: hypothetical protein ABI317_05055 [Gaiellales bacterium]